ncbi:TlpA disulfide reductase family protein [Marivirga tractuosa]|uniref:TlpA family protein disulfide reductase n=1 Tax=Marivirga tractuosa TaxID=1006 RepID=UPI0035CED751
MNHSQTILLLVLSLILLNSCNSKSKGDGFQLNGKSNLKIENKTSEAVTIAIENWYLLPWHVQEIDTTISAGQSLDFQIITQGKIYFDLKVAGQNHKVFSKPNAQNQLIISENGNLEFQGILKSTNQFLKQKFSTTGSDWKPRASYTHGDISFVNLIKVNDSITALHQQYLTEHKNELPNWYVKFEQKRLQYLNAHWKLNSLMYRVRMMNMTDSLPPNFLKNTVGTLSINDAEMLGNNRYMNFLSDYLAFLGDPSYQSPKPSSLAEWIKFYEDGFDIAKKELEGEVRDTYLAFSLGNILERRAYLFQAEWIKDINDPKLREYVKDLMKANPVLPEGAKTPYFFLTDRAGNEYKTSDFKGKILLINFWATWCKPCIKEFPEENKLVEKYKDQPVEIVNICIDSEVEKWKSYLDKYNLKTTNLYANGNWNEKLQKDFGIQGLPHSTLIDWNGKVVENKCRRASENIDLLIDELLKEK